MKFNCGLTGDAKEAAARAERDKLKVWHRWFAWYPVRVGQNDCRWLEYVERRATNEWDNKLDRYEVAMSEWRANEQSIDDWHAAGSQGTPPPFMFMPTHPILYVIGSHPGNDWTWEYRPIQPSYRFGT